MPRTAARPSPRPSARVVKKGSKILASVASDMPMPVSVTSTNTKSPGATSARSQLWARRSASTVVTPVCRVAPPEVPSSAPPAFVSRFITTCWSWMGSAETAGSGAVSASSSGVPRGDPESDLRGRAPAQRRVDLEPAAEDVEELRDVPVLGGDGHRHAQVAGAEGLQLRLRVDEEVGDDHLEHDPVDRGRVRHQAEHGDEGAHGRDLRREGADRDEGVPPDQRLHAGAGLGEELPVDALRGALEPRERDVRAVV